MLFGVSSLVVTPMSVAAFCRPTSAASLNDLSPLPPISNTSPTLALLFTGAVLAIALAEAPVLVAAEAAALVAAALVLDEPAAAPVELLLPQAATDMAETSPTAARRIAREVRTEFSFPWLPGHWPGGHRSGRPGHPSPAGPAFASSGTEET